MSYTPEFLSRTDLENLCFQDPAAAAELLADRLKGYVLITQDHMYTLQKTCLYQDCGKIKKEGSQCLKAFTQTYICHSARALVFSSHGGGAVDKSIEQFKKALKRICKVCFIANIIHMLTECLKSDTTMDRDPHSLHFTNGYIDLRDGNFKQ